MKIDFDLFWFKCKEDGNYINIAFVCNNIENCLGGEDELNCSYLNQITFPCEDNTKINYLFVCNHINDCSNGADEEFCRKLNN